MDTETVLRAFVQMMAKFHRIFLMLMLLVVIHLLLIWTWAFLYVTYRY